MIEWQVLAQSMAYNWAMGIIYINDRERRKDVFVCFIFQIGSKYRVDLLAFCSAVDVCNQETCLTCLDILL